MYLNHFFVTDHEGLDLLFIIMLGSIFYSTAPPRDHKICTKILVRSQSIDGFDEETGRMRWGRNAPFWQTVRGRRRENSTRYALGIATMAARGHPASCARLFRLSNPG